MCARPRLGLRLNDWEAIASLANIKYWLSDKTGTITKNVMRQEYGFAWVDGAAGGWHVLTGRVHENHHAVRAHAACACFTPPPGVGESLGAAAHAFCRLFLYSSSEQPAEASAVPEEEAILRDGVKSCGCELLENGGRDGEPCLGPLRWRRRSAGHVRGEDKGSWREWGAGVQKAGKSKTSNK